MDKVTRQCPQTTAFLRRKESRSGIKPGSFSLTPYRWAKPAHATRRLQRAINKANGFPDRSATIAGNPIHCPTVTSPLSPRSLARCHVTTLSPLAGPLSRHYSLPARWPAVSVCGPCQQRLDRFRSVLRSERERGPFCGQRTTTAGLPGTG